VKRKKLVLKYFNLLPLLFMLTLSILTPSSVLLTNYDDHIVQENFNEEEGEGNQEKDIDTEESEDEKKESFFISLIGLHDALLIGGNSASIFLVEGTSAYSFDFQLRPPKYLI